MIGGRRRARLSALFLTVAMTPAAGCAPEHPRAQAPHGHESTPGCSPSAQEQEAADSFIERLEKGTARFARVSDAEEAGYQLITPMADPEVHYLNWDYWPDGRILDPTRPESLIYRRGRLIAAMFIMEDMTTPGPRFGGCLTHWHVHPNLCYDRDLWERGAQVVGMVVEDGSCYPEGTFQKGPEMLHAWVADNPVGPYADVGV